MADIYCITCSANGAFYIGSAVSVSGERRWQQHKLDLKKKRHYNRHLQSCCTKYGMDSLEWNLVANCRDRIAVFVEYWLINTLWCDKIMNHSRSPVNPMVGRKHSNETKQKLSESASNRTPEHRKQLSDCARKAAAHRKSLSIPGPWKDKTFSEEHRRKIGDFSKGKKLSAETKHKLSEAAKKRWANNPGLRQLISLKSKSHRHSEGTKQKMRDAVKNKPPRKPHSEETKRKMRDAALLHWKIYYQRRQHA